MADEPHETPGLPGSYIVEQFSAETKRATSTAIEEAVRDLIQKLNKFHAWWCVAAMLGGGGMGGGVAYLVLTDSQATEFSVHHAAPIETCTLVPGGPADRPAFICRPGDPPPENVPQSALYRSYDR